MSKTSDDSLLATGEAYDCVATESATVQRSITKLISIVPDTCPRWTEYLNPGHYTLVLQADSDHDWMSHRLLHNLLLVHHRSRTDLYR